jgi:hypothetical protein
MPLTIKLAECRTPPNFGKCLIIVAGILCALVIIYILSSIDGLESARKILETDGLTNGVYCEVAKELEKGSIASVAIANTFLKGATVTVNKAWQKNGKGVYVKKARQLSQKLAAAADHKEFSNRKFEWTVARPGRKRAVTLISTPVVARSISHTATASIPTCTFSPAETTASTPGTPTGSFNKTPHGR